MPLALWHLSIPDKVEQGLSHATCPWGINYCNQCRTKVCPLKWNFWGKEEPQDSSVTATHLMDIFRIMDETTSVSNLTGYILENSTTNFSFNEVQFTRLMYVCYYKSLISTANGISLSFDDCWWTWCKLHVYDNLRPICDLRTLLCLIDCRTLPTKHGNLAPVSSWNHLLPYFPRHLHFSLTKLFFSWAEAIPLAFLDHLLRYPIATFVFAPWRSVCCS